MWKCTSECKPLSQFEIDAIVALKEALGDLDHNMNMLISGL